MRISVLEDDPGFILGAHECLVTLNGYVISGCITADEDLGQVWVLEQRSNMPPSPDMFCRKGQVKIVARPINTTCHQ